MFVAGSQTVKARVKMFDTGSGSSIACHFCLGIAIVPAGFVGFVPYGFAYGWVKVWNAGMPVGG